MKRILYAVGGPTLLLSWLWLAVSGIWAQPPLQATQPLPGTVVQPVDVIVLLDDSGSMATCWPWPEASPPFSPPCAYPSPNPPSDPNELRYSAARLLLQLADEGDRVAVWRFDSQVEAVGALGALQPVGGAENRRRLTSSLQPPATYIYRGYTRFDLALAQAIKLLSGSRQPGRSQYILLLSDGEPSQPQTAGTQRVMVTSQVQILREDNVLVFPVVLCNPTSGCAGEFLRTRFDQELVREAKTAQDLIQVFSEIFAEIKRDRYVVNHRSVGGALHFVTRQAQGVRQISYVTPLGGLVGVSLNDAPVVTTRLLDDPNIEVNGAASTLMPSGNWLAQTADFSGFSIVQADSYPELLFPPASVADSSASVRYYPAGKLPLLVARGVGPGASEALSLNGQYAFTPIGSGSTGAIQLTVDSGEVALQLGDDTSPLQLVRRYRLEARADLPQAQVFLPRPDDPGLLENGKVRLQVGFGPGRPVQGARTTVYVTDETADENGGGRPVYQAELTCTERICTDERFEPGDGRTYAIYYTVSGVVEGVRFGDWAKTDLVMEPAVYLRGMPASLNLAQIPPEGLPITVMAGTTEEIGLLSASLVLRRADTGEVLPNVGTAFAVDVPESGGLETHFRVDGLANLRPGEYIGELVLQTASPDGLPMNVRVRPGSVLPVSLRVPRPEAILQASSADFGKIAFSSSPSIQLETPALLGVTFDGAAFAVTAEVLESSCAGVNAAVGDPQVVGEQMALPLRLQSLTPIQPGLCTGTLQLRGPSADYSVMPDQISYRVLVADPEWALVTGDLDFHNLGWAGERATGILTMRYEGKTPFILQLTDLGATSDAASGEVVRLGREQIEMPQIEVSGSPNADRLFQVPVTLVARKGIPRDSLQGTYYAGQLSLGILGLSGETRPVSISFRSPTALQRYVTPWLVPIYSTPWLFCTGPLTLLLLLVAVARLRGGGWRDEEAEPLPTVTLQVAEPATVGATSFAANQPQGSEGGGSQSSSAWSAGEWEANWSPGSEEKPAAEPRAANGNNPWDASW